MCSDFSWKLYILLQQSCPTHIHRGEALFRNLYSITPGIFSKKKAKLFKNHLTRRQIYASKQKKISITSFNTKEYLRKWDKSLPSTRRNISRSKINHFLQHEGTSLEVRWTKRTHLKLTKVSRSETNSIDPIRVPAQEPIFTKSPRVRAFSQ